MTLWNYETLAVFKQSRIGNNIISFDDLKKEREFEELKVWDENSKSWDDTDKAYHCWICSKDKKEYLIKNEDLDKLPLRIKSSKLCKDGNNIYHFIFEKSHVGFAPEKSYTFRELIEKFFGVSHSNMGQFILFKIVAVASYLTRVNLRICSNTEFGKDGTFGALRYLTNQVAVFSKPKTMAKLEYGVVNRVLVVNELVPKTDEEKRIISDFLMDMGDFKPIYEKKSRGSASHGTKDSYDITNTSMIIFYNTIGEVAPTDKDWYFDNIFGSQLKERYLPLKFYGKLDVEQFNNKENYDLDVDEQLLKIARTIEWYKQNWDTALKPYKADLSFIKLSGRQKKSFERLTYFLNLYSKDEHEFKDLVNQLLKCYYNYENMVRNNKSIETFEVPDVQTKNFNEPLKVTEESVEDDVKPDAITFIKANGKNGEIGVDIFLEKYTEDELDILLRKGDVYKPRNNLLKVLE